jgi:hypothetical protein
MNNSASIERSGRRFEWRASHLPGANAGIRGMLGFMSSSSRWMPSVYFVIGQAGWFACVISAARGAAWIGVAFAIALIALHLWRVDRALQEAKLIVTVVILGGLWESTLVSAGLLAYPDSTQIPGIAPVWLLALWGLFAAQINTTYPWLKKRLWLAPLLGAIAGPLSFHAGAVLGAVHFVRPWPARAALAGGWAVLLPLVILLSRRWDGVQPTPRSGSVLGHGSTRM